MPDEPEVAGLLALMLLVESRRAARVDAGRRRWCCSPTRTGRCGTAALIAEGQGLVRRCLRRNRPGRTSSRPRSTPCTATRRTAADTDWRQIVLLYDQLLAWRRARSSR